MDENKFESELRAVMAPDDGLDIVDWLEKNVRSIPYSPMPGSFRCAETPWLAEVLRACVDPEVRLVCVQAPIQTGKSLVAELLTCYINAKAPSPTLVLQDTDPNAKDWITTRLKSLWENCPPVSDVWPADERNKNDAVQFARMTFWCLGAHNIKNLQRRSIRWLIGDECWMWPKGHMAEASARVTAFGWLGKRIFLSQGGYEGDDFTETMKSTDERHWTFECPECGTRQRWEWNQVIFPEGAKSPEGWNYEMLRTQTTYECQCCKHKFKDSSGVRQDLNKSGKYVAYNSNAAASSVGFHWNALCCRSWGELAELACRSKVAVEQFGDDSLRRIFKQKHLAQAWSDEPESTSLESTGGKYSFKEFWDEEGFFSRKSKRVYRPDKVPDDLKATAIPLRFMAVDVQRNGFYATIRSWNCDGQSRLYDWSFILTWDDLKKWQDDHGVHNTFVFVDSGDQTDDVYRHCAKFGWNSTRGTAQKDFAWTMLTPKGQQTIYRPWSKPRDMNVGGVSRLYYFSNLLLKDTLFRLRRNGHHTHSQDCGKEYIDQMQSEFRTKTNSGNPEWKLIGRRPNHIWDCEVIGMIPALIFRLIGKGALERTEEGEEGPLDSEAQVNG